MPQYSRREVRIPKTGKVVSLREARKAMGAREAWLGQTRPALRKKILAQRADFAKLERAVEAFNKTGKISAAAKAAGVSETTAKKWIKGTRLPKRVSPEWSEKAIGRRKPLIIAPEHAAPFAYVLGALMGNVSRDIVGRDMKQGRLSLCVNDRSFAQAFSKKLEESTGIRTKIKPIRGRLWLVDIGSRNILQMFNELTLYGKKPPTAFATPNSPAKQRLMQQGSITQFLKTPGERTEFLRALYDSHGSVRESGPSKTKVIVIKPRTAELSRFIESGLKENGLSPRLNQNGVIAIPSAENRMFMRTIGFRKSVKI